MHVDFIGLLKVKIRGIDDNIRSSQCHNILDCYFVGIR